MNDDEATDEPENPVVTEAVRRAIAPYARLLPPEVVGTLGLFTSEALKEHPVGISLVARLSPGLQAAVDMSADPASQGFQGFSFGATVRAMMDRVRREARERGDARFLMPDTSILILQAFLGYLGTDTSIWTASDALVRAALEGLCNGVVGALFMGLVLDLRADRSHLAGWGETGRALSRVLPRMTATLDDALSMIPGGDRRMLADYQACDWDIRRLSEHLRSDTVNARSFRAFGALGLALFVELGDTCEAMTN